MQTCSIGHNSVCEDPNGFFVMEPGWMMMVTVSLYNTARAWIRGLAIILMIIALIPVMISASIIAANRAEVGIIVVN